MTAAARAAQSKKNNKIIIYQCGYTGNYNIY